MKRRALALLLVLGLLAGIPPAVQGAGPCSIFRTWNTGDTLTAGDLNSSFTTVGITNMVPACVDDLSADLTQMGSTTDPYPAGVPSQATTLAGELERIRFVFKQVLGFSQWYAHSEDLSIGARTLSSALGTITTDRPAFSTTATWNAGGITFTLLKGSVTDTASAAGSLLVDLKVGGASKFSVTKAGALTAGVWNGTAVGTGFGGSGADFSATAQGSLWYFSGTGAISALAPGTSGFFLKTQGAAANPVWAAAGALGGYGVRNLVGQNDGVSPNTKFGYSADLVVLRNPSDGSVVVQTNTGTLTNDTGVAGSTANGRDQAGAFSSSTWLHFYFIWNGSTLATLSSTVAPPTGPTLPSGYTHWAYTGAVFYNGTPLLVKTRFRGSQMFYEAFQAALTTGAATSEATVSVSSFIPPNALRWLADVKLDLSNTGINWHLRVISGVDWYDGTGSGTHGARDELGTVTLPNISQQVFYFWASAPTGGMNINVLGYSVPNGGD